jgi:hypothetical protein
MMLGHPEALVAELLGAAREISGVAEGVGSIASFDDGREIEHGHWGHGTEMGGKPDFSTLPAADDDLDSAACFRLRAALTEK